MMRLRHPVRSQARRARPGVGAALAVAVTLGLSASLLSAPAYAANPVTPGNYRGLGFDQCEAPSQSAMSAWRRYSPFRAVGIYISGDSRACQRQTNLTPTWVTRQLGGGWHLMPITLGPQASCTTRERYLRQVRINPSSVSGYRSARLQGQAEAKKAVSVARNLGIVTGSTIFYDLEAFDTRRSSACTNSALWFVNSWTRQLHASGYASGFYSSAASGIKMLDDARVRPGNELVLPDQIWIADWDQRANTSSTYVRSDGWQPYGRAKQYMGGHNERHGGVTINIDRNYLDLRTPILPNSSSPTPAPTSGATSGDPMCTTESISKPAYRYTNESKRPHLYVPLQCLLKQQQLYSIRVTGNWNKYTLAGLRAFQRRVDHPVRGGFTRRDWISLITASSRGTVLSTGSEGVDVIRVQRAMNAASSAALAVNRTYDSATRAAVVDYQRSVAINPTGTVASLTWGALRAGRF